MQSTESGQCLHLDVRISEAASNCDRLTAQVLPPLGIRLGIRLDDQHPAALGAIITDFFQNPACPGKPSVAHGPVTMNVSGNPSQVARCPRSRKGFTFSAVRGVRALLLSNGTGVVPLQIERLAKTFSGGA